MPISLCARRKNILQATKASKAVAAHFCALQRAWCACLEGNLTGKWICRKVAEICLLLNVWATTAHFPESGRDLRRFAEICQIALNFAFHSICVCGATQEICGPPKNWPLHDDNEAIICAHRSKFAILVIQYDDMMSNTIWYKCPAEWSHLGSDVRHQRRRRLRTSSQGGKPTLLGRADAFFSPFVLRMLCLGGLAWYWVLGVGPTGYTESRHQPDELRRESWTRLPPAHGFLLRHTRKHWREKVSRNRNFRNIFPDSRGSNHYQYQILSFKWKD